LWFLFVQTSFNLQWVDIVDFIFCSCINHKTICEIEKMMVEIYNCSLLGKKLSPVLRNLSLFFVCYTITLLQYLFVIYWSPWLWFLLLLLYVIKLFCMLYSDLFCSKSPNVLSLHCVYCYLTDNLVGWEKKSQILVSLP